MSRRCDGGSLHAGIITIDVLIDFVDSASGELMISARATSSGERGAVVRQVDTKVSLTDCYQESPLAAATEDSIGAPVGSANQASMASATERKLPKRGTSKGSRGTKYGKSATVVPRARPLRVALRSRICDNCPRTSPCWSPKVCTGKGRTP